MIETSRFLIKKLEISNVNLNYLKWLNNVSINKFLLTGKNKKSISLSELEKYVKEKISNSRVYFYGIFIKNTLEHIGNIKYEIEPETQKYFMGILIGNQEWVGKGVAVEVISATKRFDTTIKSLYLVVNRSNSKAIKAYIKCGFVPDNTLKCKFNDDANIVMRLDI